MTRIIVAAWLGGVMGWLGMGALLAPVGMPLMAERQIEPRTFEKNEQGGKIFRLSDAARPSIKQTRLVKRQPGEMV